VFDSGAEFVIGPDGRNITVMAPRARTLDSVRHRLVDQVVPLAMSHLGRVVLHASAVGLAGAAVAFAGPAGAGKSTLAAAFAHAGASVVTDDALRLETRGDKRYAIPAYPGVRMIEPGRTGKRRVTAGIAFASASLPLRRLYVLKEGTHQTAVRITRMSPRDAMMALIEYAFVLDTGDRGRMAAHFGRVSGVAAGLDVRALEYPRTKSALPHVREAVIRDIDA
jgi:hypothetical protein